MKGIHKINLFFKSKLSKDEKRLLRYTLDNYEKDKTYQVRNYMECTMLVSISYKLDDRMSYLFNNEKANTEDYQTLKANNKIINSIIKDYAKTSEI